MRGPALGSSTGRYAPALGQLGCEELDVRIGGIRALERVAPDSPGHHPAVMGMLAAFIWERSGPHWLTRAGGQALGRPPGRRAGGITTLGAGSPDRDLGTCTWLARPA